MTKIISLHQKYHILSVTELHLTFNRSLKIFFIKFNPYIDHETDRMFPKDIHKKFLLHISLTIFNKSLFSTHITNFHFPYSISIRVRTDDHSHGVSQYVGHELGRSDDFVAEMINQSHSTSIYWSQVQINW